MRNSSNKDFTSYCTNGSADKIDKTYNNPKHRLNAAEGEMLRFKWQRQDSESGSMKNIQQTEQGDAALAHTAQACCQPASLLITSRPVELAPHHTHLLQEPRPEQARCCTAFTLHYLFYFI